MRLSAIALDYDGTIAHDGVLDPGLREAIAAARANGIAVRLATGRILDDLRRVAGDLHFVDGIVAENGAVLHFPPSDYTSTLAPPVPAAVIEELRRRHVTHQVGACLVDAAAADAPTLFDVIMALELPLVQIFNAGRVMLLRSLAPDAGREDRLHPRGVAAHQHDAARHGLPHRIVLDEAHYFLQGADATRLIDRDANGYTIVTYWASRLPYALLAATEVMIVTRESNPTELAALREWCSTCTVVDPARWAKLARLSTSQAVALPITQEAGGDLRLFTLGPRLTLHVRHREKYVDVPVSDGRAFVFVANGQRATRRVRTLREFVEALEHAPGVGAYLDRNDSSRWLRDVFGDHALAAEVRALEDCHRVTPADDSGGSRHPDPRPLRPRERVIHAAEDSLRRCGKFRTRAGRASRNHPPAVAHGRHTSCSIVRRASRVLPRAVRPGREPRRKKGSHEHDTHHSRPATARFRDASARG